RPWIVAALVEGHPAPPELVTPADLWPGQSTHSVLASPPTPHRIYAPRRAVKKGVWQHEDRLPSVQARPKGAKRPSRARPCRCDDARLDAGIVEDQGRLAGH